MLNNIGKGILVLILSLGVIIGGYLGYYRYFVELQDRSVELCVDLNDLKKIAAYEKKPLGPILDEMNRLGITSIGVFEETLPDANALGEIYYTKGAGVLALTIYNNPFCALENRGIIEPDRTYIYAPFDISRKRIYDQLKLVLRDQGIRFPTGTVMEVDEAEEDLRELGLGISEAQEKFLRQKGFKIIPRVWNDPRFHLGNIGPKIAALSDYDTIIFEGEDIIGYPSAIKPLADALKKNKIKYGYIEIVKQDGDKQLRKLMGQDIIRVHSVPKRELAKITKEEAIKRFVRAARERKVRLFYIRPFLPPQVDAYPVAYNLKYFRQVKDALVEAGFVMGTAEKVYPLMVNGWQLLLLGVAVIIGFIFLLNYFVRLPVLVMFFLTILGAIGIELFASAGYGAQLQKGLALLAAITFPSLAVISTFAQIKRGASLLLSTVLIIVNILGETLIGVFLLLGLLADYRYMVGIESFSGVKLALILPLMIVGLYFALQQGEGSFTDRIRTFLENKVSLALVFFGFVLLAALGIFVARSGNFVLPVPAFEKHFRNLLEIIMFIRPRTKEFLIGYPFLFLSAVALIRGRKDWLWVLAPIGTIAPISVFNSFSHIHTPIIISMIRTVNGLVLGVIIGLIVALVAKALIPEAK